MRTLGVILAGGRSSRFGSDKADALLLGRPLLQHVEAAITDQCDAIAVAGREVQGRAYAPDWPAPGMGPLAGLAGALRFASANFDQILTVSVDTPFLPTDLRAFLEPGPSCAAEQPVIGLWPVSLAGTIENLLLGSGERSMRAAVTATGARLIGGLDVMTNINTREDLIAARQAVRQMSARVGLSDEP